MTDFNMTHLEDSDDPYRGDVCWNKCRMKGIGHTRTYMLSNGTFMVHLCSPCIRDIEPESLMRLAVKVEEHVS